MGANGERRFTSGQRRYSIFYLEGGPKGFAMKRALVTGTTGQDWAYLAKFLLDKGYEVDGIKRRSLGLAERKRSCDILVA
jgi:hypothetical protein